jgi:signal transduction histidine kinase
MSRSGSEVADRVSDALTPVVLIGLVLVAFFAAAGFFLALRLSGPFRALARTAAQLGEGNFEVPPPAYAIPEAQAIGVALHSSSNALQELLRREREFTVNASHQLRTPITALRLELEDLSLWPETPPVVAAQLTHSLGELDRLATAVTELLDLARGRGPSAAREVDFSRILGEAAQRWEREAGSAGRTITIAAPPALPGTIPPGPVHQILDILIDNALKHGKGEIVLSAREEATHHSLSVTDHGKRPAGQAIFQRQPASAPAGERIGLSVAKKLAEAINGRLVLDSNPPTTFTLVVPSKPARNASPETAIALT